MKCPEKSIRKYFLLLEKIIFIILFIFSANLYFSARTQSKKQILISRIDHLITSLKNASSINESIQKEKEIYNLAKEIDYKKGLITSRFILLRSVFNQHKYDLALKLIDKSIRESNELEAPFYTLQLYVMKASCYASLGLNEDSRIALNQARSIAMKLQNNDEHHNALAMIFRQMARNTGESNNSTDSVLFYFKNSYNEFKKVKPDSANNLARIEILTRIGHLYSDKKQYDSARRYLSSINVVKEKDKKIDIILTLKSYQGTADLHFINKEYQKAITDYQSILIISDSLNLSYYKQDAYYNLSKVYGLLENRERENYYLKEYTKISDSLASTEKTIIREPLEKIFTENDSVTDKGKIFYVLIPIIIISIVSFGIILFNRPQTRDSRDNQHSIKPTAQPKIESYESPQRSRSDKELSHIIELARQNDPTLYAQFKLFDPTFTQNLLLIAPDLLASELQMCIYFRLDFETKEIVSYTNFSIRAVQGKKHRIRKKLKIPAGEDLNTWLTNL